MAEDYTELGQQVMAAQPFTRLLGAHLTHLSPGKAELEIPLRLEHNQQHGLVHGGVISYLVDDVLTFAGGSVLGPDVLTLEIKLNYLRPAVGERLVARGWVVSAGRRNAVCRCDVLVVNEGVETLCAAGQGTIARRGDGDGTAS
jgi:uncharacterized protein (TIGR00369 family)